MQCGHEEDLLQWPFPKDSWKGSWAGRRRKRCPDTDVVDRNLSAEVWIEKPGIFCGWKWPPKSTCVNVESRSLERRSDFHKKDFFELWDDWEKRDVGLSHQGSMGPVGDLKILREMRLSWKCSSALSHCFHSFSLRGYKWTQVILYDFIIAIFSKTQQKIRLFFPILHITSTYSSG